MLADVIVRKKGKVFLRFIEEVILFWPVKKKNYVVRKMTLNLVTVDKMNIIITLFCLKYWSVGPIQQWISSTSLIYGFLSIRKSLLECVINDGLLKSLFLGWLLSCSTLTNFPVILFVISAIYAVYCTCDRSSNLCQKLELTEIGRLDTLHCNKNLYYRVWARVLFYERYTKVIHISIDGSCTWFAISILSC